MITIVEIDKLSHSRAATITAQRGALLLMERGITNYPASWDSKALAAMSGEACVGILTIKEDEDDLTVTVTHAHVTTEGRSLMALGGLLVRLREKYRGTKFKEIWFTYHEANDDMAGAAKAFGAEIALYRAKYVIPAAEPASA